MADFATAPSPVVDPATGMLRNVTTTGHTDTDPTWSTTTTNPVVNTTGGSEQKQLSPEAQAAFQAQQQAQQQAQEAQTISLPFAHAQDAAERSRQEELAASEQMTLARQNAVQAKYKADMAAAHAKLQARADEYEQAGHPEEEGWGSKIASAIGMALGAYGAALARTPNFAAQIIEHQDNLRHQQNQLRLSAALKRYEMQGASVQQVEAARRRGLEDLEAMRVARGRTIETAYQKAMAQYPQHAASLEQMLAKQKAENAEKTMTFLAANTGGTERGGFTYEGEKKSRTQESAKHTESSSTSIAEGDGGGSNKPTESEAKFSLLGNSMLDEIEAIRGGATLDPSDLDKIQSNALKSKAADKSSEQGGQLAGGLIALGRKHGFVPKSRYDDLAPEKQKTANAYDNLVEKYTRVLTGAGMPVDEASRMAQQDCPVAGDSDELVAFKLNRLEREAKRMVALGGKNASNRIAAGQASLDTAGATGQAKLQQTMEGMKQRAGSGKARGTDSGYVGGGLKNMPAVWQGRLKAALKVPKGDPEYEDAQSLIEKLGQKYGEGRP